MPLSPSRLSPLKNLHHLNRDSGGGNDMSLFSIFNHE